MHGLCSIRSFICQSCLAWLLRSWQFFCHRLTLIYIVSSMRLQRLCLRQINQPKFCSLDITTFLALTLLYSRIFFIDFNIVNDFLRPLLLFASIHQLFILFRKLAGSSTSLFRFLQSIALICWCPDRLKFTPAFCCCILCQFRSTSHSIK